MNKLQQNWLAWEDKFIELTQREKIIIMFAAVFLTAFAMFKLLIEPTIASVSKVTSDQRNIVSQLLTTNNQITDINTALKVDPNEKIKQEIKVIKAEIAELQSSLDKVMTEYIAPEQMAKALTKLLKASEGIRIVGMTALPPSQIQHNTDLTLPNYYRHQFTIEIEGDYFALMNFVRKVSVNNKQFGVQDLGYQVIDYPTALMTLTLITISDNEKVIRL